MSSTSSSVFSSPTSPSPSPSPTQQTNTGGPSSPLLFFVALGFGVVFTNLWIIVGVKYCFRYNQRNRARLAGDDPDAVDLATMPRQRRRREKRLMTMDEVNEKFPLTKYKTWRSSRAQEGLPTAGGIDTVSSRPASVKNLPRVSREDTHNTKSSTTEVVKEKINFSEPSSPVAARHDLSTTENDQRPKTATTETDTVAKTRTNEDEEEDQIQTAIPAEQLPDPGDCCAICIDVLEDDDDVRGLVCGHAFHASCVDPWLTSRRACCPLCKADYYTPKPRPEGEMEELRRRNAQDLPPSALSLLTRGGPRGRGPPFVVFGSHYFGNRANATSAQQAPTNRRAREQSEATAANGLTAPEVQQQQTQQSWRNRINLPRLPAISRVRNGAGAANEPGQQPTTPAQLEAGHNR